MFVEKVRGVRGVRVVREVRVIDLADPCQQLVLWKDFQKFDLSLYDGGSLQGEGS